MILLVVLAYALLAVLAFCVAMEGVYNFRKIVAVGRLFPRATYFFATAGILGWADLLFLYHSGNLAVAGGCSDE